MLEEHRRATDRSTGGLRAESQSQSGGLFDDVEALFEHVRLHQRPSQGAIERGVAFAKTTDGEHGRIEQRRCWTVPVEATGLIDTEGWRGLRTVALIERERTTQAKTTRERGYYISSLGADAQRLMEVVRRHWQVENRLHWVLDVSFGEDQSRSGPGMARRIWPLCVVLRYRLYSESRASSGA